MSNRLVLGLLFLVLGANFARCDDRSRQFPKEGSLVFAFRDEIDSPAYSWPRTLIEYPVDFSAARIHPDQLLLKDADSGAEEAMQLSEVRLAPDGALSFARVNFFSSLSPGQSRKYVLSIGHTARSPLSPKVVAVDANRFIEVDNGVLRVRIPGNYAMQVGEAIPGPIYSIDRGSGWIGQSHIVSMARPITQLDTQEIESGPLFRTYRVSYQFRDGGSYIADVRVVLGYKHVEFSEQIDHLHPEDHAVLEMSWNGFEPTKRFPANGALVPKAGLGIDEPVVTPGTNEEPHWYPPDVVEDPSSDMFYRLAPFEGNAPHDAVPVMSFYNDRPQGDELSLFVPNSLGWNDGQYMIWQPTTRLQVHFRYTKGLLVWTWPLIEGKRQTAIVYERTDSGIAAVEATRSIYSALARGHRGAFEGNGSPTIAGFRMRDAQLLRSWYGSLSLEHVKNWTLDYPTTDRPPPEPFEPAGTLTAKQLVDEVELSQLMLYPLGPDLAVMNISHRIVRPMVEHYLETRNTLPAGDRRRVDAILLLSAYLNAGEEMAPMRTCATGTPNMSADGFAEPTEVSVLYPDHPMAKEWRDQFQKIVQIQGCFYTRPDVPLWGAQGGRWTESLGTYNWADLRPLESAQTRGYQVDGRNRLANEWMAQRAHWLVDELSAPIHNPDPYWRAKDQPPSDPNPTSLERQYPSHGAHGTGTGIVVSDYVSILAQYLLRYDPLAAEHLLWAQSQATSVDTGEWARDGEADYELKRLGSNTGTNPHLESSKYTGHGIILRAGVGTPEEVSVHLDQVDAGPNYRWGDNGEGSSGTLFFFAGGKPWTATETENTGDHANDDTTGLTTFGVLKAGEYRSIGANELDQPLYDLGIAQFGSIAARKDRQPYSWPAYKSRSILLVGTDYFILADDAVGPSRFTWFTARDLQFPKIIFLEPLTARPDHWAEIKTRFTKGFMRDNVRESEGSVVLVTHKKDEVEIEDMVSRPISFLESSDIREYSRKKPHEKGAEPSTEDLTPTGVYRVRTSEGHDIVFRNFETINYKSPDNDLFDGTAGVIRHLSDGSTQVALFQGALIGARGLTLSTSESSHIGISAIFTETHRIHGYISTLDKTGALTLAFNTETPAGTFYIDGASSSVERTSKTIRVTVPSGRHTWEFTDNLPTPNAPTIARTEHKPSGVKVIFQAPAGADRMRLEKSLDGGRNWSVVSTESDGIKNGPTSAVLEGLPPGKLHVRVVAGNAKNWSAPGPEYPIYITNAVPLPPDGLDLILKRDRVEATWGEVLGVSDYRLYRRVQGTNSQWTVVYEGLDRHFVDITAVGVVPSSALPGVSDNFQATAPQTIYEYAVAAIDGNGEGARSLASDTNPTSWLNWWPSGQERQFKRQTGYWLPPYVSTGAVPPLHYPTR